MPSQGWEKHWGWESRCETACLQGHVANMAWQRQLVCLRVDLREKNRSMGRLPEPEEQEVVPSDHSELGDQQNQAGFAS